MNITLVNSIFFNFFICKENRPAIIKKIIMEIFYNEHKVNYMIVSKPPGSIPGHFDAVEAFGRCYYPKHSTVSEIASSASVIVINRRDVMPVLSFRMALWVLGPKL